MTKELLVALAALALSACNTMEGLGEDIEQGGENLSESAEDTKNNM